MLIRELERYRRRGCRVEIVYLDRKGQLSQREVIILSVQEGRVKAFCYTQHAIRQFDVDNILAMMPAKVIAS